MNDLDTLRPEIREAVAAIDKGNGVFVNGDDCDGGIAWATARAELLRLQSTESRANEWQLRAERAEAELAALKAEMDQLRADAETGKAWRTDSSLEEWFPITAAELKHVKAELAALKARIANSRTTDVFESEGHAGMVAMGGLPCEWIGKNVRMLVED